MAANFARAIELAIAVAVGAIGVELAVAGGIELAVAGGAVGIGFGVIDDEDTEPFLGLPPFDFSISNLTA